MTNYILGFNYHHMASPAGFVSHTAESQFPNSVTLGFRRVFWNVFSTIHEYSFKDEPFTLFDSEWRCRYVGLFISSDATRRLGFSDPHNIFAVISIEMATPAAPIDLDAEMFRRGMNEQDFAAHFLEQIAPLDEHGLLRTLKHSRNLPGKFQLRGVDDGTDRSTAAAIAAFNFYFLLMLWQTEREQVATNLSVSDDDIETATEQLLLMRQKLMNIERLFLTTNVSNRTEVKAILRAARERFNVRGRFDRLQRVNEGMEKFFEIRTQGLLQMQSKNLNRIALALAFLGLPLALMSMLLALTPKTDIIISPLPVISSSTAFVVACALVSTGLLGLVVGAMALRNPQAWRKITRVLRR